MANQLAAEMRLICDPAQSFTAARNGSVDDFSAVAWNAEYIPDGLLHDLLVLLCSKITESRPPSVLTQPYISAKAESVAMSLYALGSTCQRMNGDKELLAILCSSWPTIQEWMIFICRKCVMSKELVLVLGERKSANEIICLALLGSAMVERLAQVIFIDDEIQWLAVQLWMQDDNIEHASTVLIACAQYSESSRLFLDQVCWVAGGADRVAKLLVHRLAETLKSRATILDALVHIRVVFALQIREYRRHAIEKELSERAGPGLVAQVLRQVSVLPLFETTKAMDIISVGFRALSNVLLPIGGTSAQIALPIVLGGFLEAVVNSSYAFSMLASEALECVKEILSVRLANGLVYCSTALASADALLTVKKDALLNTRGGLVGAQWRAFERRLLEVFVSFRIYESISEFRDFACEACGGQPASKKCARCSSARYCDENCQLEGWKRLGHKEECQILSEVKGHLMIFPTKRDKRFFLWQSKREIRRHFAALQGPISRRLSNSVHRSDICLTVDCTSWPPTLSVARTSDVISEVELESAESARFILALQQKLQRAADEGVHYELVVCIFKRDGRTRRWPQLTLRETLEAPLVFPEPRDGASAKRAPGRDVLESPLKSSWDEVDEVIYRLSLTDDCHWWVGSAKGSVALSGRIDSIVSELELERAFILHDWTSSESRIKGESFYAHKMPMGQGVD